MLEKVKVYGQVTQDKQLKILNGKQFHQYLDSLPVGTELEVKIKIVNNRRSEEQNNYYWAILRIIANETGYEKPDDLHEHFKNEYNRGKSTSEITPKEFADYIQKIVIYASGELGITLPSPPEKE